MNVDVLLVEDDEADAALILEMFARARRSARFRVNRASSLEAADAILGGMRSRGAAVILDLSLAQATDETTLAWIQSNAATFSIMVLTGNDDEGLPRKALRAGAQDYLTKWDFNADALTRAILYAMERQGIQQELRQAKDAAEGANRAKTEFLANMSHEIRTPLAAVLGAAELLAASSLAADQQQHVELLSRAGNHLRNLVDEILDLTKIEAGGIVLEQTDFTLRDILDDVCGLLRPRAESKRLAFVCEVAVPSGHVTGDPHRLRQILVNLVGNAIKFTVHGEVCLRAQREDGGPLVRFTVSDSGPGIAPAHRELIFEAFAQTDASISRLHGGTGLGLAIARRLVDRMGGHLGLTSTLGVGSEFSFSVALPPASVQAGAAGVAEPREVSLERGPQRRWRVVVADDAPENRLLLAAFLRSTPLDVAFVATGEEAIEAYRRSPPDAMLLDLHMPRTDGIAAAKRIRRIEAAAHRTPIPLIAYTADAFNDTRDKCLAAGFTDHLVKPVPSATLYQAIVRALRAAAADAPGPVEPLAELEPFDEDLRALLPGYVAKRLGDVAAMRRALRRGDYPFLEEVGHRIKGSGLSYGLPRVSELASHVETAARSGRTEEIGDCLSELETQLGAARSRLERSPPPPRGGRA